MDVATIVSIIIQVAEAVMKYGPNVFADLENVWTDLKLAYDSATSGVPLTPEQQKQVDIALENANNALNVAIASQQAQV